MRSRPFDDDLAFGRAAAEEDTTEAAIYDAAHEMLCEAAVAGAHPDRPFYECPGCGKLVDDDDTQDHAMRCGDLRARVIEDWQAEDDYREARR